MLTGSVRSSKLGDGASMISLMRTPAPKKRPPSRGCARPSFTDASGSAQVQAAAVRILHEQIALAGDGLAGAKHQQAPSPAPFREPGEGGAAGLRREIEEYIAAQDEVEQSGTGRRIEHRMDVKAHGAADRRRDSPGMG